MSVVNSSRWASGPNRKTYRKGRTPTAHTSPYRRAGPRVAPGGGWAEGPCPQAREHLVPRAVERADRGRGAVEATGAGKVRGRLAGAEQIACLRQRHLEGAMAGSVVVHGEAGPAAVHPRVGERPAVGQERDTRH